MRLTSLERQIWTPFCIAFAAAVPILIILGVMQ